MVCLISRCWNTWEDSGTWSQLATLHSMRGKWRDALTFHAPPTLSLNIMSSWISGMALWTPKQQRPQSLIQLHCMGPTSASNPHVVYHVPQHHHLCPITPWGWLQQSLPIRSCKIYLSKTCPHGYTTSMIRACLLMQHRTWSYILSKDTFFTWCVHSRR